MTNPLSKYVGSMFIKQEISQLFYILPKKCYPKFLTTNQGDLTVFNIMICMCNLRHHAQHLHGARTLLCHL